jgi:hypothetical protein
VLRGCARACAAGGGIQGLARVVANLGPGAGGGAMLPWTELGSSLEFGENDIEASNLYGKSTGR